VRNTRQLAGVTLAFAFFSCIGLLVPTYGFASCLGAVTAVSGCAILLCYKKQPLANRYRACGIIFLFAAAFHLGALGIYVAVLSSYEHLYRDHIWATTAPVAQFVAISFEVALAILCYQTYWAIIKAPIPIAPGRAQPTAPAVGVALPAVHVVVLVQGSEQPPSTGESGRVVVLVQGSEVQPPSTGENGRVWASSPGELPIGVFIPMVAEADGYTAGRV